MLLNIKSKNFFTKFLLVYVGDLPRGATERELDELFRPYGQLKRFVPYRFRMNVCYKGPMNASRYIIGQNLRKGYRLWNKFETKTYSVFLYFKILKYLAQEHQTPILKHRFVSNCLLSLIY